jgi:hypothetical protein
MVDTKCAEVAAHVNNLNIAKYWVSLSREQSWKLATGLPWQALLSNWAALIFN